MTDSAPTGSTTARRPSWLRRNFEALGWSAAFLAAVVVFAWGAGRHSAGLVVLGAVLFVVVALLARRPLAAWRERVGLGKVAAFMAVVFAVGAVFVAFWPAQGSDFMAFVGVSLCYLAVGQVLMGVRERAVYRPWWGTALVAVLALAFGVGLVVYAFTSDGWAGLLMLAAVGLAPVAIGLVTEAAVERVGGGLLPVAGAALVLVGAGLAHPLLGAPAAGIAVAVAVLFVVIGAIASNTEGDIVVVIVAVGVVWASAPRDVSLVEGSPASYVKGQGVIVALGDSYMSGEGAKAFYRGTNSKGENECRRAPTAYAAQIAETGSQPIPSDDAIPAHTAFYACSGATADQIAEHAQPAKEVDGSTGLTQLAEAKRDIKDPADVKLVVVSIGGNDANFGEIGQACVIPGDCAEMGASWLARLDKLGARARLEKTYGEIRAAFPNAPILVVPYPIPLRETTCKTSALTGDEHRFLHGYTEALDDVVKQAAENAHVYYLGAMRNALLGLRICDVSPQRAGVNFLAANPVNGVLLQQVSPANWFHNSLHPNARGHQVLCETLAEWIVTHQGVPAVAPAGQSDVSVPPRAGSFTDRCGVARPVALPGLKDDPAAVSAGVGAGAAPLAQMAAIMSPRFLHCAIPDVNLPMCRSSVGNWQAAQVARTVAYGLAPVPLVVFGSWLIWLWLIEQRRAARA
jgi:lysophospholipase L1-like esterase